MQMRRQYSHPDASNNQTMHMLGTNGQMNDNNNANHIITNTLHQLLGQTNFNTVSNPIDGKLISFILWFVGFC